MTFTDQGEDIEMENRVLFTIGVYGTSEQSFFQALQDHHVQTFVDVRARRGMRGSEYSYVNATALQHKLLSLNIKYVHLLDFAPTHEMRLKQKERDSFEGAGKRSRAELSREFVADYTALLQTIEPSNLSKLFDYPIVIFCVERNPSACHRSLVAKFLSEDQQVGWADITP